VKEGQHGQWKKGHPIRDNPFANGIVPAASAPEIGQSQEQQRRPDYQEEPEIEQRFPKLWFVHP
jgi:hypothetical protein